MSYSSPITRYALAGLVAAGSFVLTTMVAAAFSAPTAAPPGDNPDTPINTSASSQVKSGGLSVGSLAVTGGAAVDTNVLYVDATNDVVNIGTSGETTYRLYVNGDTYSNGDIYAYDDVFADAFIYNSDRRLKGQIQPLGERAGDVLLLQPKQYVWKDSGHQDFGLIAQDVEQYFPEAVAEKADGYKAVDYPRLIAPLLEVVRKQQQQIDSLQEQIDQLKANQ